MIWNIGNNRIIENSIIIIIGIPFLLRGFWLVKFKSFFKFIFNENNN